MRTLLFLTLAALCHPLSAIHTDHTLQNALQPAIQHLIQTQHLVVNHVQQHAQEKTSHVIEATQQLKNLASRVSTKQVTATKTTDALLPCTAAQQACIDNQSGTCGSGCQSCDKALSSFRCQPTTRCLTETQPMGIAWPTGNGYVRPKVFEVGGMGNCAVRADCYFMQQACLAMGSDDMGSGDQNKCNAFALDSRYAQQECRFCQQTASDAVSTLTVKDCTYTPKVSCIDNTSSPPVTFSNTCPGSTVPTKSSISTSTKAPVGTPVTIRAGSVGSTAAAVVVSIVSVAVTAMTVAFLA